ncbi:TolC family protein [Pseudomonas syringae group genomosp. 3]|uniref:Protein CyaE n=1 Tax=Pseudomonas syringae pv. primulae TaxID=251707 RepID=A0A3M3YAI7_9PSED|nr:TolC family protein [Pseudomonas syringae group genomosp. 3]RMO79035.1 Protein CyaE [Pseudomonas syringae pv. primulae]RMU38039.1 Protein CyaE [Pseudomonas syringae pv. primulae]
MKRVLFSILLAYSALWAQWSKALDMDIFSTDDTISKAAVNIDGLPWSCEAQHVYSLLTLEEMVERVLCHDPKTKQLWAYAKAQAALVGASQSAYLPRVNGVASTVIGHNDTVSGQLGEYSSHGRHSQLESRISLSWVLYDFGQREAALRSARQLLIAANANQDIQLQETFILAAQLYYDTLAAQHNLAAASRVAAVAAENLKAADAKYEAGAVALSDRLQAKTAYIQACLNEVRASGALNSAKGLIAMRMGMPPQTHLELAGELTRRPANQFIKSIDTLLEQAQKYNPSLIAAKARLSAAMTSLDEAQAAGRPTLSFVANTSDIKTNQPMSFNGDSRTRDNSVGLQLNIPLFEGFERRYRMRGVQAQLDARRAELSDAEQSVSLSLWSHYQTLKVSTYSLESTADWVEQSNLTLKVVQGRYNSGVGSMIEILNALTAYSTAEQQHIIALNSWQLARLNVAADLGRLGFWVL